jgi:hypothetical protein
MALSGDVEPGIAGGHGGPPYRSWPVPSALAPCPGPYTTFNFNPSFRLPRR